MVNSLVIAVIIVFAGFIVAQIVNFILNKVAHLASKTKSTLDDKIIENLKAPIRLIFIFIGLVIAFYYLHPSWTVNGFDFKIIILIGTIMVVTFFFARLLTAFITWYTEEIAHKTKSKLDDTLLPIINKIIAALLYVIAFLIILDKLGIQIGPLVASLGVAGIAVALALQDTLSNFFAAIHISADRPIKKGDYIKIGTELEGYVEDVGWRSTKVRTISNNFVIIPNAKLSQSTITNYNIPKKEMSVVIQVGVAYDSDLDKVEKITIETAKKIMKTVPGGVEEFEPFIRYHTFGDSSINFSVILRTDEFVNKYLLTHEFIKALKKAYDKEKINIPFPITTVYMKK